MRILNKLLLRIIMFCVLSCPLLYSQGTIKQDSLFSNSLGYYKKVNLYLPQGYNPAGTTRYRVIYFLHGATGNQASNSDMYAILDSLIANNIIQPVIIVKPDASYPGYWGSFYTNSSLYGMFEDYMVLDLVQFIDANYKTIADRDHRCIMGYSMGGFGSIKLSFKHSTLYRAAASHSGLLDLYHITDMIPRILQESGSGPPYTYIPSNGSFSSAVFGMCGAFSPHPGYPPYNVDFILNSNGVLIDSVFNRWKPHNPAKLSSNINASTNLPVYFDCGLQDDFTLLAWNNSFRDTLSSRNIPFVYYTYTGTHTSQIKSRYAFSFKFLDSAMNHPSGIELIGIGIPGKFELYQNYPNPFNPSTKIKFDVPTPLIPPEGGTSVRLIVYDILGREVASLIPPLRGGQEGLQPGSYEVEWNASNYPSGVYFYKLTAGDYADTKKMVLLK